MSTLESAVIDSKQRFYQALEKANDEDSLEQVRIVFLARQGEVAALMGRLKELSPEDKKKLGPLLNKFKQELIDAYERKKELFITQKRAQEAQKTAHFDVTAYKPGQVYGSLHPYTKLIERIEDIFISMGYEIADGPELETEEYNFEALNIPADHPARDMWDTFWLESPGLLLRTHTSSVQVHVMKKQRPPIAVVAPGRCFRHEATDATHDFMFMQLEGLFIDKNVSIINLLATMRVFLQELFERKDIRIVTRPSYYPFVEPGLDLAMSCPFCPRGCPICKKTGFLEICGAGLLHPNVLSFCGIDPQKYSGFAFGFGLSRLVMLKYGIYDIRLLQSGRIDFLKQF